MKHESINPKYARDEITEVFIDGLQRDLSPEEERLISGWTQTFNKDERATIINLLKELLNKHKRHD
ncbi:hypothetical protein [Rossellomorea aquimaris]|uniref:Uncharacterized protein n=1 Tax=Rossellomorea aquimaris TaxID=189382 RepID=A0A366EFN1_9BACI|nr:hypothetical protein [Rossellomorea aquimaris]RBP01143.1 hypothetical protein DET59_12151 [Rossellomorea aquimaris]